jgi:epoxyqueuosine reductase
MESTEQLKTQHILGQIEARAKSLGFCLCGVIQANEMTEYRRYLEWLEQGNYGCMGYLDTERHRELRQDPRKLSPWVRSIVVLAWPYELNRSSGAEQYGQIAGYVDGEDYHIALPRILKSLVDELPLLFGGDIRVQVYTDSAPILERELAVRAGLGWIGKNSCLIHPEHGSSFLLTELFLDQEISSRSPQITDHCGTCHRCVDACPTSCIRLDRTIDARQCISAWTIEDKGVFSENQQKLISNRLFGCDICQAVCPWNKSVNVASAGQGKNLPVKEMIALLSITETEFKTRFRASAISRAKRPGLIRNLCAVLGNLGSVESIKPLKELLSSEPDPLIYPTAQMALKRIQKENE